MNEVRIKYSINEQGWALERIAKSHSYAKTQDCYWMQIFESAEGTCIIAERDEKAPDVNPAEKLETLLAPAASAEVAEDIPVKKRIRLAQCVCIAGTSQDLEKCWYEAAAEQGRELC